MYGYLAAFSANQFKKLLFLPSRKWNAESAINDGCYALLVLQESLLYHRDNRRCEANGISAGKIVHLYVSRCLSSHPVNVLLIGQPRIMQPRAVNFLSLPPFFRAREKVVCTRSTSLMVNEHLCIDEIGAHGPSDVHAGYADAKRWRGRGKWRRSIYETRRRDTPVDRESNRTNERLRWFAAWTREGGGIVECLFSP